MLSTDSVVHQESVLLTVINRLSPILPVVMGSLLLLTAETGIGENTAQPAVAYTTAGALLVTGLLQVIWKPLTTRKLACYHISFGIAATMSSIFAFGFETMAIYPAWAVLFFIDYIFFGLRASLLFLAFALSGVAWALINSARLTTEDITLLVAGLIAEGLLFVLLAAAWSLAEDRQKRLEESSKIEEIEHKRLAGLVNSIVDSVVTVDETGVIQLYNAATLGLFDTNKELQGSQIGDLVHMVDDKNQPMNIMDLALQDHIKSTGYTNFYHLFTDGDRIALSIKITPISLSFPEKGQGSFAFIFSDITKLKSLEEEREEFISVVSHELRTPIAITEGTISNIVLLVQQGKADPATIVKNLDEAHEQVMYLAKMTNDLSTLGRAEREVNLELVAVDIDGFAQSLYRQYQPEAKAVGLSLDLDIVGKIGQLSTSQLYLEEILQNLITNAIKYTPRGSVSLHIEKIKTGVFIAVSDTGHGISKSDQKKVFNKFYRTEDYHTRETSGTGLGLYVAERLAKKLGSHIELESRLNYGSTFSFVLPITTK